MGTNKQPTIKPNRSWVIVTLEVLMVLFDIAEVEVVYIWNTVYRKMADSVVLKQKLRATE